MVPATSVAPFCGDTSRTAGPSSGSAKHAGATQKAAQAIKATRAGRRYSTGYTLQGRRRLCKKRGQEAVEVVGGGASARPTSPPRPPSPSHRERGELTQLLTCFSPLSRSRERGWG